MQDMSKEPLPQYPQPWPELVKMPPGSVLYPNTDGPQGASLPGVTVPPEVPAQGALVGANTEGSQVAAFNALAQASAPQAAPVADVPSVTPEVTE
jgi:hypothetical protein